jgi:hypothetical protein
MFAQTLCTTDIKLKQLIQQRAIAIKTNYTVGMDYYLLLINLGNPILLLCYQEPKLLGSFFIPKHTQTCLREKSNNSLW